MKKPLLAGLLMLALVPCPGRDFAAKAGEPPEANKSPSPQKETVKPTEFLFSVQLVLGSEASEDKTDEALQNDPVIKEIRNLMKYKNFLLLDTSLIRTIEQKSARVNIGKSGEFVLDLTPKYIKDGKDENIQADLTMDRVVWTGAPGETSFQRKTRLITSQISMKSGKKTVVGVSKSENDKGLILIIMGTVLRPT